ncbi:unnamed protein product, partial [Symbiodinium necroappetens]
APVHVCGGRNCCGGRDEFLKKAEELVSDCIVAPLPQPALNKWTRLGPTIARVTLMSHFCGLLKHAMQKEFGGLAERVHGEDSVDEQAEAVGLPLDERAAWKRVADKRRVKSVEFVADKDASWGNLVWLVIASPMLVLHWKLFKHAKWCSEADSTNEEPGRILKQFCVPALNPAADVIDKLFELLRVPNERLRCVCFFHGPCTQWPPARQRAFQQLVLLAAGQLWRKLVLPWQAYPWKMWPIVWGETEDERCCAAVRLLAERDCCLDQVFTQKLKSLVPDPETLASESTREFLSCCFTRLVVTSTFVERRFASYGAWNARRAATCRLPMLVAKHVTSCLKEFVDRWRQREQAKEKRGSNCRPVWQESAVKGMRLTGLHVFTQECRNRQQNVLQGGGASCSNFLSEVRQQWSELSKEDQSQYSRQAKERNARARAFAMAAEQEEEKTGGPWGMASLRGQWPLQEEFLNSVMEGSSFQEVGAQWRTEHSMEEGEYENVSDPLEQAVRLFPRCPPGMCEAGLTSAQSAAKTRLHANLCTLVQAHYPTADKLGSGVLVLRFKSVCQKVAMAFAVCFATREKPPECAMLQLDAGDSGDAVGVPAELWLPVCLERDPLPGRPREAQKAAFWSDRALAVHLSKQAQDWSLSVLRLGDPAGSLSKLLVVSEEEHTQEALDAKRRELLLQQAALRAASAARAKQRREQKGAARKPRGKGGSKPKETTSTKSKSSQTSEKRKRARSADADESSSSSRTVPPEESESENDDESSDDHWLTELAAEPGLAAPEAVLPTRVQAARAADADPGEGAAVAASQAAAAAADADPGAGVAAAVPANAEAVPILPPPPVAARPGGRQKGRTWQRRGDAWGPFTISPIVRSADGRVTGYGAICGLHKDTGPDGSRVQCKKAAALSSREGAMTADEIRVGLKRWLMAGLLDTDEWPPDRMRRAHVALQLKDLEGGPSENEMDRWMDNFVSDALVGR